MKGIVVSVYRDKCSTGLNQFSDTHDEIFVECPGGNWDTETDTIIWPIFRLVIRQIGGKEYRHLEPAQKSGKPYMASGNFAYSCDSRFREINQYPLPIHDRQES